MSLVKDRIEENNNTIEKLKATNEILKNQGIGDLLDKIRDNSNDIIHARDKNIESGVCGLAVNIYNSAGLLKEILKELNII